MTTWIIVLCAAIFVLDRINVLPVAYAPLGITDIHNEKLASEWSRIPKDQLRSTAPQQVAPRSNRFGVTQVFVNPQTGEPIPIATTYSERVPFLQKWLQFTTAQAIMYPSKTRGLEGFEFWRLIGYMFLHADVTHIAFNMMGLFFFGPIVEQYLGRKRFLAFYLLCGIFGALLYMVLNLGGVVALSAFDRSLPGLLPNSPFAPLIGASAGVYGVIMAGAYLLPNELVYLFFAIPMRLKTLAIGLIMLAVATVVLQAKNAGGEAAHLGGAAAGWWFIRRPHVLHGFFDFLGRADPTSSSSRLRRAKRGGRISDDAELDRLLAKVREHGLPSLTDGERRRLQEISRRR